MSNTETCSRIRLGANGPDFSRIVAGVMKWGIWGHQLDTAGMDSLINFCLDHGISTFDHADIYGAYTTEAEFGKALALVPSRREQMQIVTKCGIKLVTPNRPSHSLKSYDTSREHILRSAEQSLRNLQTDYLDLLLIHRPSPLMHADEIAEAFLQLHESGKVLYFGVSNFTPAQFNLLNDRFSLVTNQVEASVIHRTPFLDGTFDQMQQLRLRPMVWSPLGGGQLFRSNPAPDMIQLRSVLQTLAEEKGETIDQLLLAWLLKHPSGILPVLGTARPERLQAAIDAEQLVLSREEWFRLWEAATGSEVP